MLISSTNGFLSIVNCPSDGDHVLVRANKKVVLSQLFDDGRIKFIEEEGFIFGVSVCKQELADILVKMVKSIDYTNFESGFALADA
ncbi:hypothetical protein [Echinicola shivajiensis]|uniref:hypothetical protein n=1 Tax=Echinicola shivajiensis TaxID=1035916 RepID=UPI001BFC1002|nr:hypothetical protein [Echinicola shivajiensis]